MRFNHKRELKEFMAEWKKQEAIMRKHGMSDEAIKALFDADFAEFKTTRNFYLAKEEFVSEQSEAEFIHTHAKDKTAFSEAGEHINTLDVLDQIENPALLEALKSLQQSDLELLIMAEIQGLTHQEIADLLGTGRRNITKKIARIIEFIKSSQLDSSFFRFPTA